MAIFLTSLTDPRLASLIAEGAIGVIPTDTVYGLVGAATSPSAIAKLYSVKQRERQPGTTIAASVTQLADLGFPLDSLKKVRRYWPNPVSVEMSAAAIPAYLHFGQTHLAARIPGHSPLRKLLRRVGPLMTTSANTPHAPTAGTLQDAVAYFGDSIDFYVDGGDLRGNPPSTIIGFDPVGHIIVYREGAVPAHHLATD